MAARRIKIVITGPPGAGKTAYTRCFTHGEFETSHVRTLGVNLQVNLQNLSIQTTRGSFDVALWDTAGDPDYAGLRGGYALGAQGVIGIYDGTSRPSVAQLSPYIEEMCAAANGASEVDAPDIPVFVCGNKSEEGTILTIEEENELKDKWGSFTRLSVRSCYHLYDPIETLLRKITGHDDLYLTANPSPLSTYVRPTLAAPAGAGAAGAYNPSNFFETGAACFDEVYDSFHPSGGAPAPGAEGTPGAEDSA